MKQLAWRVSGLDMVGRRGAIQMVRTQRDGAADLFLFVMREAPPILGGRPRVPITRGRKVDGHCTRLRWLGFNFALL